MYLYLYINTDNMEVSRTGIIYYEKFFALLILRLKFQKLPCVQLIFKYHPF